jgi:hypothetical protein
MKISQIIQETSTTAGSIAPSVEHGFVKMQTRNPSVYGNTKAGNLLKGKKTSKPFANSLNEAAMKDLAYDLQTMKPAEFQKKYGKTREEMKASMNKQPQQRPAPPVNETDLSEQDLIVVPGQGRSVKTGFVPHGKSRIDHEVEMARSDLFSAAKNAQQVYSMIKDLSEEEGLDGWVQEKIIKANDYLNTIREYLEGKQVQGVSEGVADMHSNELLSTVRGAIRKAIKETGDQSLSKIFVCLRNARPASEALKNITSPNSLAEVDNALQEVGIDLDDLLNFINKQAEKYGKQGVAEGSQRGDSLVTDALKIMRGAEVNDAIKALKTVLGDREYNSRRGFYNFYIKQMIDAYGQRGANESLGTTGAMTNGEMGEGKKVDRMVKHVAQTEKKLGHSKKEAENIAWATANKRGMLDNKNKKK